MQAPEAFTEREFYAREFGGRTLALALPGPPSSALGLVAPVVATLRQGRSRVVLLTEDAAAAGASLGVLALHAQAPRVEAEVWRSLRAAGCAVVGTPPETPFHASCRALVRRLGLFKLVWIDAGGGLAGDASGSRRSFVDLDELSALLAPGGALGADEPRRGLLLEVRAALEEGIPAINLCTAEGLDAELFSYAGSGTLFTRERYVKVRALGVDDFDAASDLIARGVAEGYLAERTPDEVDAVLAGGFGAFVEDRHLAGIGALLEGYGGGFAELASLYTLTRFLGEGVGAHLVAFALERARERSLHRVFACTTQERVGSFFERCGFARVGPDALPAEKWRDYRPERRALVRCYSMRVVGAASGEA